MHHLAEMAEDMKQATPVVIEVPLQKRALYNLVVSVILTVGITLLAWAVTDEIDGSELVLIAIIALVFIFIVLSLLKSSQILDNSQI